MATGRTPGPEDAAVPSPADTRLLRQYLGHLRVERGLAANTIAGYRRDLTRYLAFLAARGTNAPSADEEALRAWMRALRTGEDGGRPLGAASAARALAAVRGLCRFLDEERAGAADGAPGAGDPSARVPAPSLPLRLPHPLPIHDVEALIAAAGGERGGALSAERALRDRALVEVLYGAGARISEAIGLDIDDIDLDARTLLLRGKGSRQRLVPLGGYAADAVAAYLSRARPPLAQRGSGTAAVLDRKSVV